MSAGQRLEGKRRLANEAQLELMAKDTFHIALVCKSTNQGKPDLVGPKKIQAKAATSSHNKSFIHAANTHVCLAHALIHSSALLDQRAASSNLPSVNMIYEAANCNCFLH
jgi:hypothetical protein